MDAKTKRFVELLAESVSALSQAMNHADWCHGKCRCGVKAADDAVQRLWDALDEFQAKDRPYALEASP